LFGDDSQHLSVRAAIVEFEEKNELVFKKFLMPPINQVSFQEHATLIRSPGSWATQVEVNAVATMFQVPVCFFKNTIGDKYNDCHWEVVNPLKLSTLSNSDIFLKPKVVPHHFELIYWDGSHYNCVVLKETKKCSNSVPVLTRSDIYVDIT